MFSPDNISGGHYTSGSSATTTIVIEHDGQSHRDAGNIASPSGRAARFEGARRPMNLM